MQSKQKRPAEQQKDQRSSQGQSGAGGREFGNVIEPTQAQMASGNEGLTGDSDKNSVRRNEARKRGKKAA
ncbi:MAG: hypothetical protein WA294_08305 [Acidobacteriaceae bacterium]